MKVYLENAVFSTLEKQQYLAQEEQALDEILERFEAGELELVTSEVTKKEFDALKDFPERLKNHKVLERFYRLLPKVPFVEEQKMLGSHSLWDKLGGASWAIIEDDPIWKRLLDLGIDRTDAHHLMLAIRAKCDVLLTMDGPMLDCRSDVEKEFRIKMMRPSEL